MFELITTNHGPLDFLLLLFFLKVLELDPNLAFLRPLVGPPLVNHHFVIPNDVFASKNYDISLLKFGVENSTRPLQRSWRL
jgi:hypothetical protein